MISDHTVNDCLWSVYIQAYIIIFKLSSRVHVREHAHACSPSAYELYLTPKDIYIPHEMSCILQLKHVLQCIVYMSLIADLCLQSDDIVMETFYHKSGQIYTCVYQGGQRFYMDSWETQVMTSLTLAKPVGD